MNCHVFTKKKKKRELLHSEIIHSIRPEVGKYWDVTILKGTEDLEEPKEILGSQVEVEEDNLLKVRDGNDQMNIEDGVEVTKK